MSDIDPFKYPPAIHWESCITLEELNSTFMSLHDVLRTEHLDEREYRDTEVAAYTIEGMIQWIEEGKPGGRYGGRYEV